MPGFALTMTGLVTAGLTPISTQEDRDNCQPSSSADERYLTCRNALRARHGSSGAEADIAVRAARRTRYRSVSGTAGRLVLTDSVGNSV